MRGMRWLKWGVEIMGRVGNFASENGSGCLIVFIMEEYPKVEVQDKGGPP